MSDPSIGPRKRERQARVERQRRLIEQEVARGRRRRRLLVGGGLLGLALLAAAVLVVPALGSGGRPELTGLQTFTGLQQGHVQGTVQYAQTPPAGGPHAPVWQNCGAYTEPIQNETAGHALEHGAVWITYQPDLPRDQVDALRAQVRGLTYVLLSPFPNLPSPVVASAWGRQLRLDSASDPRLAEFIRQFRQGRQAPETGALCTNGVGQPG